ncbi:MAG: sodium:proton antiporter [Candidatus Eisenbacteria bacterium]|nr:sodium:proton antiporter [Candidatus Eisenbacteria bacterium]
MIVLAHAYSGPEKLVDREAEGLYLGGRLPLWSGLPFLGILLSIALFPLLAPVFWRRHYVKVSFFWAAVFALPFLVAFKGAALHQILHIFLVDYVPFIILLWGLFTVSGGILLRGRLQGTPRVNVVLLLIGTVLASWMGTTGASMLMIRPVIRANASRRHKSHVVIFFIFLVANIGGALTPLGDPPLFLGFLHGVPFFWTFSILPHMLLATAVLLGLFYALDTLFYRRESREALAQHPTVQHQAVQRQTESIRLEGAHNFLFLAGIIVAVLLSGTWRAASFTFLGVHLQIQDEVRDVLILAMGALSLFTTSKQVRDDNHFTWFPIKEVAYLFAGIFMTIIPLLMILRAGSTGALAFLVNAVNSPAHYFWAAGAMSSFLDNAPTYLTFFNLALGKLQIPEAHVTGILSGLIEHAGEAQFGAFLKAISAGAVFFGANTYIGNAPNFMVRSIAEENRIEMPSFFGYMLWSAGILIPLFLLVTVIFF